MDLFYKLLQKLLSVKFFSPYTFRTCFCRLLTQMVMYCTRRMTLRKESLRLQLMIMTCLKCVFIVKVRFLGCVKVRLVKWWSNCMDTFREHETRASMEINTSQMFYVCLLYKVTCFWWHEIFCQHDFMSIIRLLWTLTSSNCADLI